MGHHVPLRASWSSALALPSFCPSFELAETLHFGLELLGEGQEVGPSVKLQHAIRSLVRPEGLARFGDFSAQRRTTFHWNYPGGGFFCALLVRYAS